MNPRSTMRGVFASKTTILKAWLLNVGSAVPSLRQLLCPSVGNLTTDHLRDCFGGYRNVTRFATKLDQNLIVDGGT